ncbi:MAG: pyridoxal-dependent decarboxylase [Candidatus Limnocylindrales bacterium]
MRGARYHRADDRPTDTPAPDRVTRHRRVSRPLRLAPGTRVDRVPGRGASREALAQLGEQTWAAALQFLYGTAVVRAMGDPSSYEEARTHYYGSDPTGSRRAPGSAPAEPAAAAAVIDEFSTRLAGGLMNSQHPRQFGYFTPPPLPMSIMGELLAQVVNQGVDVWHAGPYAAFVEEEVVRWLCDLIGYGEGSFGLLTSGGVMANFMGMNLARDLHLGRLRGLVGPAARQGPGGRSGLHERSDALFDRPRARRARLPARHPRRPARRRRVPPSRGAGRGCRHS